MAKKTNNTKANNANETKVVCPNCGEEFAIPTHTTLAVGVVIGKDSNLGTISPALAGNKTKVDERIEAMQNAGIDTSKFFSVTNPDGQDVLMIWKDGIPTAVADDDPILAAIMAKGTIPNRDLFRRWVMSQMFHMILSEGYGRRCNGFTGALQWKGYKYQWKMITNEMNTQAKLYAKGDMDNFSERNIWFNKELVVTMMEDYLEKLKIEIDNRRTRKCKGVPYKRFSGKDIFVSDLYKKVYTPIRFAIGKMKNAKNPADLAKQLENFTKSMETCLGWDTPQCKEWMDAYKGCGAYYTLKNMVLFHDVFIRWNGHVLKDKQALSRILVYTKACAQSHEGYKVLGWLKGILELNKINVAEKIKSWRKK